MSHSGPTSRRNTVRSNDQLPLTPVVPSNTSSNAAYRRTSIRNDQNTSASQASTPSSVNPSVVEDTGYQPGAAISHPAAGQVVEASIGQFEYPNQYTFAAGGPLMWDWSSNNMDFGDFTTTFYEPQGQLAGSDIPSQHSVLSDFSTPYRVGSESYPSTNLPTTTLATDHTLSLTNPSPITQQLQQQAELLPTPVTAEPGQAPGQIRAGMKRKAEEAVAASTSTPTASAATPTAPAIAIPSPAKRQSLLRTNSSTAQASSSRAVMTRSQSHSQSTAPLPPPPPVPAMPKSPSDTESPRGSQHPIAEPSSSRQSAAAESSMKKPEKRADKQSESPGKDVRRIAEIPKFSSVLPAGKVFPIQIGSELFRLSGASISSDGQYIRLSWEPEQEADASRAPSYFSHYFSEQLIQTGGRASAIKTLYIDRDPVTFRDIALHLQGRTMFLDYAMAK